MKIWPVFFALLVAGCVNAVSGVEPWIYKAPDYAGYARAPTDGIAALVSRAEMNFRASPAFPEHGPRVISVAGVARRSDGRTLIAFSIGGIADVNALYVFNDRGEIIDRYLHSFWGVVSNRRPKGR